MKFYLINFVTVVSEVFLINYSQIFCTIECSALKYLNLHTKRYLAGSLRVVLFRLCFSLFTLMISQKDPLFILLYLLRILIYICQIPVLMFFRQELCKIDHWLRANKLSLNYNKTNFMLLNSQKHNPTSFKVIIDNHSISPVGKPKYLGVLLDNKLSWKPHLQKVKTQLSRACGILNKLKHYTTKHNLY